MASEELSMLKAPTPAGHIRVSVQLIRICNFRVQIESWLITDDDKQSLQLQRRCAPGTTVCTCARDFERFEFTCRPPSQTSMNLTCL